MIAVIKVGKIHTVSFTICDSFGHCFPSKAFLATLFSRRFPRTKAFVPFLILHSVFCDPLVTVFVQDILVTAFYSNFRDFVYTVFGVSDPLVTVSSRAFLVTISFSDIFENYLCYAQVYVCTFAPDERADRFSNL